MAEQRQRDRAAARSDDLQDISGAAAAKGVCRVLRGLRKALYCGQVEAAVSHAHSTRKGNSVMSQVATEHVLVVPTAVFHRLGHFQGFCGDTRSLPARACSIRRIPATSRGSAMEQDPSFKQLIPYVIFRHRDASGQTRLFQYTRGKGQGESRLHAKRSIGIGGHISADDAAAGQRLRRRHAARAGGRSHHRHALSRPAWSA